MTQILKPRLHQNELMVFHNRPGAMMGTYAWHGMGLGKTLEGLWLARQQLTWLKSIGIIGVKFMVILPKSAIPTWKKECYEQTPDIYRDMVIYPYSQLHNAIKSLKYMDIRFLVFDESHYLKSPETDRIETLAQFLMMIENLPGAFKHGRIFLGSGTPAPNHAAEFYTSWALCCSPTLTEAANRLRDMTRYENWKQTFTERQDMNWTIGKKRPKHQQQKGYAVKWKGVANEDKLWQILNQYVHYRRVEDCVDLPSKQEIPIDLHLEDDKLLEKANIEEPDAYMALVERLARAKTPFMLDWVKDFLSSSQEQIVVFAMNRHPIEELKRVFPNAFRLITGAESNTERAQNLKDFQDGKIRGLAMTYSAGSESLNLQNCRYSLYHGWPWTDGRLKQAMARTWRQGQKQKTFHYFLTSGANDQRVLRNVQEKEEATIKIENMLLGGSKKEREIFTLDDLI